MRNRNIIDDGFNAELVENAFFDGILEIPTIDASDEIIIPEMLIPFSKCKYSDNNTEFVVFYENDINFTDVLRDPDSHLETIREFQGMITLDCSLYLDPPLTAQISNVYRSRAIGHYFQSKGMYVIPNVRWGDERS